LLLQHRTEATETAAIFFCRRSALWQTLDNLASVTSLLHTGRSAKSWRRARHEDRRLETRRADSPSPRVLSRHDLL